MAIRLSLGAALFSAVLVCAGATHAQEPGGAEAASPAPAPLTREQIVALADYEGTYPADHAAGLVNEIVVKLQTAADELGIPSLSFDLPVLQAMVADAMPLIPDDRHLSFNYTISFNLSTRVSSAELVDRDDGVGPLRDTRGCGIADIDFQVIHFSRLAEGDYVGHHCILTYDAPGGRMTRSQFYIRNATRDLLVDYDFVVGLGNSYDASEIVAERTVNGNIVLAQAIGAKGLDMLKAAAVPAD